MISRLDVDRVASLARRLADATGSDPKELLTRAIASVSGASPVAADRLRGRAQHHVQPAGRKTLIVTIAGCAAFLGGLIWLLAMRSVHMENEITERTRVVCCAGAPDRPIACDYDQGKPIADHDAFYHCKERR